jgi:hypothetical protein
MKKEYVKRKMKKEIEKKAKKHSKIKLAEKTYVERKRSGI